MDIIPLRHETCGENAPSYRKRAFGREGAWLDYNSGADLVYPDDFQDNIKNYQMLTGQLDSDGRTLSSNAEVSGRFHTDWLSMMYPRLKLARNLLRHDGAIFMSIDDGELATLRLIADDVFGEENLLACFVWKSRQNKDNRSVTGASVDHEYIVCYGRRIRGSKRDRTQYSNPDEDKDVHAVGAGTLFACLDDSISRDDVEAVARAIIDWHKELAPEGETTIVFRDNGFADDVAKSNLAAILVQAGFDETRIRSL